MPDAALRADSYLTGDESLAEPGKAPKAPDRGRRSTSPRRRPAPHWKDPKYKLTGYASFYDNGTTAMRLPRGTVVRICGAGGCIQRTVTDYGPQTPGRIVDLYRPDFFKVCGCASWSGTTRVTVSVY